MISLSNLIQFHNFALSLLQFLKFFGNILDSFELWKFWTRNTKVMAIDKKSILQLPNLDYKIFYSSNY
jgi:hypothetical protein